jgi:hypothetical protein
MNLCRGCGQFADASNRLHVQDATTQSDLGTFCSMQCIEGYVAVSRTPTTPEEKQLRQDPVIFSRKGGQSSSASVVRTQSQKQQQKEQDGFGTTALTELISLFRDVDKGNTQWNTVAVPLMDGIRAQLLSMRTRAVAIARATYTEIRQSIDAWAATRNLTDKLKTFELRDQEWTRVQVEATTVFPTDLRILYVKEKLTAFRGLIRACNALLGPASSTWSMYDTSQGAGDMKALMASPLDVRLEYEGFITETEILWDDTDPGIFLNYDWDDANGRKVEYIPDKRRQPARRGKAGAKTTDDTRGSLVQSYFDAFVAKVERSESDPWAVDITRARFDWIQQLASVLEDMRDNIIGMQSTKVTLANFVRRLLLFGADRWGFPNFAIVGNPGTGKTLVASKLGDVGYYMGYLPVRLPSSSSGSGTKNFVRLTQADFKAPYSGQTAHVTRMQILRGLGRVMAIDEAYQLVSGPDDQFGQETLSQIVNDIDEYRGLVSVALLGYREQIQENLFDSNPGLARRVTEVWELPNYTAPELYAGLLRAFATDGFAIPLKAGVIPYPEAEKNIVDMLTALHAEGVFEHLNQAFVDDVIPAYKTAFALVYNRADERDKTLMLQAHRTLDFGLLADAVVEVAASKWNTDLVFAADIPQEDVDYGLTTMKKTDFARPAPPPYRRTATAESPPQFRRFGQSKN